MYSGIDIHYVKRSFRSNSFCFLEFHKSSNDLEPFPVQYFSRANSLLLDHTGSESNENEFNFLRNFTMKMKRGFSVLFARYGSKAGKKPLLR